MVEFLQLAIGGLKIGAIYGLAAIGFVVIHKATQTVNFAHGAFVAVGAYVTYYLHEKLQWHPAAAYLLAPMAVGILAVGIEWTLLRPLRRADLLSVIVCTVFLGIAMMELLRHWFQSELLSAPSLFADFGWFLPSDVYVSGETAWVLVAAIVAGVFAALIFDRLPIGRAMRAIASSYRGAQLCGYSVERTYAAAWFFGGALAGFAGVLAAGPMGISPELTIATIVPAFVAAVIGGFDSVRGAVIGGILLGLIETFAAGYISSAAKNASSFVIVFLILTFRPHGLFSGEKRRNV
jgi:branched-chain amino acid transport system permease protein